MTSAYTVSVGDTWFGGGDPFHVTVSPIKPAGKTVDGETLYELCGGRLYQPAQYADAVHYRSEALAKAAGILFERAERIRRMAEEYRMQAAAEYAIEQEEAA